MTSKFELTDDGTLDTVVACVECGEHLRYTWDGCDGLTYEDFVAYALLDAEDEHDCPGYEGRGVQ